MLMTLTLNVPGFEQMLKYELLFFTVYANTLDQTSFNRRRIRQLLEALTER
jgi:hypothetical protein